MPYNSIANRKKAMPYDDDDRFYDDRFYDDDDDDDDDEDDDHPSLTAAERNPNLR